MLPNEETMNVIRPDPYIGKVIDKYRLVERLGAGGMGLVYRAEQARIKRHVAVKMLPLAHYDELNVKRIEREATSMGNLRHPNIATIFDFGFSEEGQPYLVMELIAGRSLGNLLLEHRQLDPLRAIKIMAQAADAMDYAHRNGIIHRDLKPDNIMLDCEHTDDFVKVLDFGIAKSVDSAVGLSQSLTRPGMIVGSPLYMSPEQCMGQKLDTSTDIYSLGVILYEVLTGIIPGKGATIYETIGKKTTEAPPPFPPEFSEYGGLEKLTLSMLSPMSKDRPGTMQDIRDALLALSPVTLDIQTPVAVSAVAGQEEATDEMETSDAQVHDSLLTSVKVPAGVTTEAFADTAESSSAPPPPSQKPSLGYGKIAAVAAFVLLLLGGAFALLSQNHQPASTASGVGAPSAGSVSRDRVVLPPAKVDPPINTYSPAGGTLSHPTIPESQQGPPPKKSASPPKNQAVPPPVAPERVAKRTPPRPAPSRTAAKSNRAPQTVSSGDSNDGWKNDRRRVPPGQARKKGKVKSNINKHMQRIFRHLKQISND